jgi:hypothetical protein
MRSPANGILRSARIGITPPEYFSAGSCTPNSAPPPRTCVGGAAPPGCRLGEPAARCIPSVPPRGWLGPARGEFLAPNSPHVEFWATEPPRGGRNPLGFVRWVVPIKARGRYTLCSAIHCAEGVRRVRKGDFWKCV